MAKRKVNKSQEIRDYVKANREASAKDVVEALKRKGIKVSAPMVANVKSKAGLTRSRRGRPPGSSTGSRSSLKSGDLGLEKLIEAKRYVAKFASIEEAITAIKAFERLHNTGI